MFKTANPFFIHTLTSLRAGSGDALGIVDLPIQRERHTGFPKIESSSLKGAIREAFEDCIGKKEKNSNKQYHIIPPKGLTSALFNLQSEEIVDKLNASEYYKAIELVFGPENGGTHAGALGFTDARILLFPVKSMRGVFVWITCPMVLERFMEDLEIIFKKNNKTSYPELQKYKHEFQMPKPGSYSENTQLLISGKIILEEYAIDVSPDENTKKLAAILSRVLNKKDIKNKLIVLSDGEFKDFVNLATEIITRIKIAAETGTVADTALFTEEYLPPETILYSLALAAPLYVEKETDKGIFKKQGKNEEDLVLDFFTEGIPGLIQIGGNATIGKGLVRIIKKEESNGNKQ